MSKTNLKSKNVLKAKILVNIHMFKAILYVSIHKKLFFEICLIHLLFFMADISFIKRQVLFIKLPDERKNIQRNMKKSLVFCFSEIYSFVLNIKKMCLGLQKVFFGGRGFRRGFQRPYAPSLALCIRHLSVLASLYIVLVGSFYCSS